MNRERKRTRGLHTLTSNVRQGGIAYKERSSWRRSRPSSQTPRVTPGTRRRAAERTLRPWDGTRDAERLPRKSWDIGEPCALKGASTVRRREVGKGLPRSHQEAQGSSWQVGEYEHLAGLLSY